MECEGKSFLLDLSEELQKVIFGTFFVTERVFFSN